MAALEAGWGWNRNDRAQNGMGPGPRWPRSKRDGTGTGVAVLEAGWDRNRGGRAQSGMLPCFFGGSVSRLVRSVRSARVTWARVADGAMTAST